MFLIFAMEVSVVKKVLSLLTFLSVFSLCTLASAYYIPREEIALGGIFVGASPEYVKSVYGEPTQSESGYDTMGYPTITYTYNDTFKVRFYHGADWWAGVVETTANNGIGTPAGVRVGMPASVLDKYYGKAVLDRHNGRLIKSYEGSTGQSTYLDFDIANGKIVSIRIFGGE